VTTAPTTGSPNDTADRASWTRFVPLVEQLRGYERRWLANDAVAGVVVVSLLVPAGMAYAQASGLPAVTGLYATIVPLLVYALVGPSRVMVMGPDSALAPLILAAIVPLAADGPAEAIALAGTLSIIVGLVGVLAGLARFGFLAELLSTPVRYGYLNGIALAIVVAQLPKAFGFSVDADGVVDSARAFVDGVVDGATNEWALAMAAGSLTVILVLGRITRLIPGVLVAVVGSIVVTLAAGLTSDDLALVGELPGGFPTPRLPSTDWDDISAMFAAALGISFVAFADTSVLARVFALKRGAKVDSNQELVALGLVNVTSGFFQGFPVSGSASRTPVAEAAGARTQLTGVVAALVLTALLVFGAGAFRNLPQATLAAVVIAAALRLFEIGGTLRLARLRGSEFLLSMAAFVAVALFGAITGVGIAIALSVLNFLRKAWMPHTTELVRVDGLKGYHDGDRHPEGRRVPGLLLYRFDAPLFFANARFFVEDVLQRVDAAQTAGRPVQVVVVTAEPITDVDVTAIDALEELVRDLAARDVTLRFAELKGHVRERLEAAGVIELIGRAHLARTTGQAVRTWVDESGVEWVDWEDRNGTNGPNGTNGSDR
jgi:high affinity sulfate transporter 1